MNVTFVSPDDMPLTETDTQIGNTTTQIHPPS